MADYANISDVRELTIQRATDDEPILRDDKTLGDVFGHLRTETKDLINELKNISRQVNRSIKDGTVVENTIIMPEMATLLENQAKIINHLLNNTKELQITDFPHFRMEAAMSIPHTLSNEVQSCKQAVAFLKNIIEDNEAYGQLIDESEKICSEMESVEEFDESDDLADKIQAEVDREYKEIKKDMKKVLDVLFDDQDNIFELLHTLIRKAASTKKEDEWYKVTDPSMMETIVLLKHCNIIISNPQNPLQVKMQLD